MTGDDIGLSSGRRRAIDAVIARMAEMTPPLSPLALASRASIDRATVAKFLTGERWPQLAKRTALERALDWRPGTIEGIAAGGHADPAPKKSPGTVRRFGDDFVQFLESTERDLTDTQREILELELRAYARRRAAEIKRDL